jgi:hypothetical protein
MSKPDPKATPQDDAKQDASTVATPPNKPAAAPTAPTHDEVASHTPPETLGNVVAMKQGDTVCVVTHDTVANNNGVRVKFPDEDAMDYTVSDVTAEHFILTLDRPLTKDIKFSWEYIPVGDIPLR